MNLKRRVWLPPDGDTRLVRFQQDLASLAGFPASSLPCHLELRAPGVPVGPVVAGSWLLHEGEPAWEASDDRGSLGVFRFGLQGREWRSEELADLPVREWRWTRGVTALLNLEMPLDDASFILWSWSSRRGWRADLPRE